MCNTQAVPLIVNILKQKLLTLYLFMNDLNMKDTNSALYCGIMSDSEYVFPCLIDYIGFH